MTVELYRCPKCRWTYRSPVRLQDPPLHTCNGKALQPAQLVEVPAEAR